MNAFFVAAPSFLAGAAATLAFFVVFRVLIKLFFFMVGSSRFEFGPGQRNARSVAFLEVPAHKKGDLPTPHKSPPPHVMLHF